MGTVRLEIVVAAAANGVIGRAGGLPWRLPDDLKRFKAVTMGRPVIMGRKTWESIGRALPGRKNIVVSRSGVEGVPEGVMVVKSLGDAISDVGDGVGFVIGGGMLYEAAMPHVTKMHLTEVDGDVDGDAYFPKWERGEWKMIEEIRHEADEKHERGFWFRTYERV